MVKQSNSLQRYGMGSSMIIFDLFSGTGSATQAFRDAGHTVISFELNPKQSATENVDIMTLKAVGFIGILTALQKARKFMKLSN